MFALIGLNHHILEKMCDVTPVINGRTEETGKYSGRKLTTLPSASN